MMNQKLFLDSSALIAFFVKSETNHLTAKQYVLNNSHYRWVILETVFDETVTWIRTKISSYASLKIGQILRNEHRYVTISNEDEQTVWEAFCKYDDKKWSYTDFSLLVMANRLIEKFKKNAQDEINFWIELIKIFHEKLEVFDEKLTLKLRR